jgi:LuxR family maltose regulon positive regulatory protein
LNVSEITQRNETIKNRSICEELPVYFQDLRFSAAETVVFLQQTLGERVDHIMAAILEEKTEGWVTGLRLAVLSVRHQEDLDRIISGSIGGSPTKTLSARGSGTRTPPRSSSAGS